MRRSTALLLLIAGIGLIAFGLNTTSRLGENVSGASGEHVTWVTVLGTVGVIAGGLALFVRRRN